MMKDDMPTPLNDIEDAIDKVVSPERVTRWVVRIVLLFVLISVGITVAKLSFHWTAKVDRATTDRDWFVQQQQAVEAARLEERAAREALERHHQSVKDRSGPFSFSHSDDREAADRLNQQILGAQKRKLSLVGDYNTRAGQLTDPAILNGLPSRLPLD